MINNITVASDNDPTTAAKEGNVVTFAVTFSETVTLSTAAHVKVPFTIAGTTGYEAVAQSASSAETTNIVNFAYTVPSGVNGAIALEAGPLTLSNSATVKDAANNDLTGVMPSLSGDTVTIDTTAPVAPGIDAITTPIANTTPEITGSGVDGDTITLWINGNPTTYTATVDSGIWSITPSSELTAGTTYNISATATDPAGNTSAASTAQSLTIVASIETIYVSAGDTTSPYYTFTTDSAGNTPWNETVYLDTAYTFKRLSDATTHPFYVSDNTVNSSTTNITITGDGGPSDGIEGTETLTVAFTGLATSDSFFGYCTTHTDMRVNFTIEASAPA